MSADLALPTVLAVPAATLTDEHQQFLALAKRLEAKAAAMPHFTPGQIPLKVMASAARDYVAATL